MHHVKIYGSNFPWRAQPQRRGICRLTEPAASEPSPAQHHSEKRIYIIYVFMKEKYKPMPQVCASLLLDLLQCLQCLYVAYLE